MGHGRATRYQTGDLTRRVEALRVGQSIGMRRFPLFQQVTRSIGVYRPTPNKGDHPHWKLL